MLASAVFQFIGIVWLHIGHIFQVGTLLKGLCESGLVDHFLSGGVDEHASLRHKAYQVISD